MKAEETRSDQWSFLKNRMLSSLSSRNYRLYYAGTLGQFAAMAMQMVTGPLLMYRLTGSSALLGLMSLVNAAPMIVMSLFGGAICDRVQKKYILIVSLFCYFLVSLAIALLLQVGYISSAAEGSWRILLGCAFFQGICMGFLMPSIMALLPELVEREQIMNATALNMLGLNIVTLVFSGIAGFMIDALDFKSVYYTIAGMYIWAIIFMLFVARTGTIQNRGVSILADIQDGLKYIRNHTTILFILAFSMVVVVLSMPYQQLLPIFADRILKVGATGMGVMLSISGIGAMMGSLALSSLPNRRRGIILLVVGLVSGLSLAGFASSASWYLSLAFIFFVGLAHAVRNTMSSSLLQVYSERGYMGRVMSIFNVQFGIMSISTFIAGVLAERIAVQWVVGGLAGILITFAIFSLVFSPRIRSLD